VKLETMDIGPGSKINPSPYNPRVRLTKEDPEYHAIAASLEEFGLVLPLVWNSVTGNLVGGHQRYYILLDKGYKQAEVSIVEIEDIEREKALNVTLNNIHAMGKWAFVPLEQILADIEGNSPDLYDRLEMHGLRHELAGLDRDDEEGEEEAEDEFAAGDGPKEMALLPYESYDYVMLMFKDQRDFMAAIDHFGLEKVRAPRFTGKKAIGFGRVIDGAEYLKKIREQSGSPDMTDIERELEDIVAGIESDVGDVIPVADEASSKKRRAKK